MTPERVLDHVEQGLGLLLTQFKGKPRIEAWLGAYLRQCQELEDAIYEVLLCRMLDRAVGVQLDALGRIVGELRGSLGDTEYKLFIRTRVRINRSRGNADDILDVLGMVSATPVLVREYRYATFFIEALEIMDRDPTLIYRLMDDARAAGTKLTLVVPTTNTRMLEAASSPNQVAFTHDPDHACGACVLADGATPVVNVVYGTGDDGFGLASDVVTVRDASAAPVAAPPTGPTITGVSA